MKTTTGQNIKKTIKIGNTWKNNETKTMEKTKDKK
jgi:hypothetical protein